MTESNRNLNFNRKAFEACTWHMAQPVCPPLLFSLFFRLCWSHTFSLHKTTDSCFFRVSDGQVQCERRSDPDTSPPMPRRCGIMCRVLFLLTRCPHRRCGHLHFNVDQSRGGVRAKSRFSKILGRKNPCRFQVGLVNCLAFAYIIPLCPPPIRFQSRIEFAKRICLGA